MLCSIYDCRLTRIQLKDLRDINAKLRKKIVSQKRKIDKNELVKIELSNQKKLCLKLEMQLAEKEKKINELTRLANLVRF